MMCIILAAGYATRLYPLTQNFPKPLLKIRDKTILDLLIDDIETTKEVSEYIVVTNHKYYNHFLEWSKTKTVNISIIDNGTETNETRLGAVKDIQFAVKQKNIKEDLLIIAGDNILDFSLGHFINYTKNKKTSCVMRYYEPSLERLKKCGVLTVDDDDLVTDMTEKSLTPATNWCCPPFYYITENNLALIDIAIEQGCNVDSPGSLIVWLCKHTYIYAMEMQGNRYDIGDLESYEGVHREYRGIIG
ncbi:MAG TPA: sugar phosphate nucleotidyltransferase [Clostridia bacterium]|jgi:glucose-1-phosphate thymidylyltransferase|nr:NTP transferase domain-containing protein [Clostridiaceae bacterium]HOM34027.1 sugar phosphate nucleotidyltransferase [Clostridia bacterium]HRR36799.1 sugar phosphate nucleotidyltransferase [Clostridia bacterium]